jgi:hypothetical protein
MVPQGVPLERFNLNSINFSLGIRYTFGNFGKAKDVNTEQ